MGGGRLFWNLISTYRSAIFGICKYGHYCHMAKNDISIEKIEIWKQVYVIIGVQNGYKSQLRFKFCPLEVWFLETPNWSFWT